MPVDIDTGAFLAGVTSAVGGLERAGMVETQRVGSEVERRAEARAPRRTGALAASITSHRIKDGVETTVGVDYGAYVEYGTSDTPAQPFLRPALNEVGPTFGRGISV